jgi:hypothetical protein
VVQLLEEVDYLLGSFALELLVLGLWYFLVGLGFCLGWYIGYYWAEALEILLEYLR